MLPVAATNRLYSHVSALVAAAAVGRRRLQQLLLTGPSLRVLPLQPLHAAPAAMVPLSTAAVAAGGADIAGAKKVIRKEIIRTLKALSTDALALQSGFFESSVAGRHPCLHVTHHPSPPAMQHSTQHNTPSPCTHAPMHPCTHAPMQTGHMQAPRSPRTWWPPAPLRLPGPWASTSTAPSCTRSTPCGYWRWRCSEVRF